MGASGVSMLGDSRSRSDAAGGIETRPASWTLEAEKDGCPRSGAA